jgi:NADH-quinone oxidoreductase subunit D
MAELKTDEMVINMGPQHPSTHGVLRLELLLDGEIVENVKPHIGYLHRCFEKHCEAMTYPQVIPYTDRLDYVNAMSNELGYVIGVEKLLGIEVPERVEYIRVIMAELQRIASHLVAIGTYGNDTGAFTPFLYCFIDREKVLELFEMTCGARMLYNYIWVGGLSHDIPDGFVKKTKEFTIKRPAYF